MDEYRCISKLDSLPDEDKLARMLEDAEEDINAMTFNRITARGFDTLTLFQQEKVKRAIARQADFRYQYGELLRNPLASYSINGVSMSWDKSMIREYFGIQTCADVISCLIQTGLMYRGVMA